MRCQYFCKIANILGPRSGQYKSFVILASASLPPALYILFENLTKIHVVLNYADDIFKRPFCNPAYNGFNDFDCGDSMETPLVPLDYILHDAGHLSRSLQPLVVQ